MHGKGGFGYIQAKGTDAIVTLSDDSRLSSTSLLRELIDPSSTDEIHHHTPVGARLGEELRARHSARQSLSYLRQAEEAPAAGLVIDYQHQPRKDRKRRFEDQRVPQMTEFMSNTLTRNFRDLPTEDLRMPLMRKLGIESETPSWKRRKSAADQDIEELMRNVTKAWREMPKKKRRTF